MGRGQMAIGPRGAAAFERSQWQAAQADSELGKAVAHDPAWCHEPLAPAGPRSVGQHLEQGLSWGQAHCTEIPLYEDPRQVDGGLALPHCDLIRAKCRASGPGSNEATVQGRVFMGFGLCVPSSQPGQHAAVASTLLWPSGMVGSLDLGLAQLDLRKALVPGCGAGSWAADGVAFLLSGTTLTFKSSQLTCGWARVRQARPRSWRRGVLKPGPGGRRAGPAPGGGQARTGPSVARGPQSLSKCRSRVEASEPGRGRPAVARLWGALTALAWAWPLLTVACSFPHKFPWRQGLSAQQARPLETASSAEADCAADSVLGAGGQSRTRNKLFSRAADVCLKGRTGRGAPGSHGQEGSSGTAHSAQPASLFPAMAMATVRPPPGLSPGHCTFQPIPSGRHGTDPRETAQKTHSRPPAAPRVPTTWWPRGQRPARPAPRPRGICLGRSQARVPPARPPAAPLISALSSPGAGPGVLFVHPPVDGGVAPVHPLVMTALL
uniref:uncharacterized protein LOC120891609 n=1 Tax=Ictidomys tridecemlineatus TaxID=43179 RepID=UPI001A9D4F56|nr:uncharacterized protein LOC120891609 [Ictidomys tridecemlineatus]